MFTLLGMDERWKSHMVLLAAALVVFLQYSGRCLGEGASQANFIFFGAWAYVFFADYLTYRKAGSSLLVSNTSEVFALALGSLAIMSVFEILNFRFEVWRYLNSPPSVLERWVGLGLCWASFLPSVIVTSELLLAYGVLRNLRVKRFLVTPWFLRLLSLAGSGMLLLALAVPGLLWPLGFAGLFFLSEPLNYNLGLASLLRDLSWGVGAKTARLAASGLVCGLLWSGFNDISGTQFVYSIGAGQYSGVLGLPLIAYAVFPVLAVGGYSLYSLCSVFRGGRTWEKGVWAYRGRPPAARYKWIAIALALFFCFIALSLADITALRYI